jgi:hypothetical protein
MKTLTYIITSIVIVVIGLMALTVYRTHAATPPLSDKEKLALRTAQAQLLQAQQELAKSPVWLDLQAKQAELNHAVGIVFESRKLKQPKQDVPVAPGEYILCDGPAAGPACAGLQTGELALRPVPPAPAAATKK